LMSSGDNFGRSTVCVVAQPTNNAVHIIAIPLRKIDRDGFLSADLVVLLVFCR
jgi:hypothetical protein